MDLFERKIALLEKREQAWSEKVAGLQNSLRIEYHARVRFENENKMLRLQLGQEPQPTVTEAAVVQQQQDDQVLPVVQDNVLISPQKFEPDWVPDPSQGMPAVTYATTDQIFPEAVSITIDDPEATQQAYTATVNPTWDGPEVFTPVTQNMVKPEHQWTSFELAMAEPTRYDFSPVDDMPLYSNLTTTSWQVQPSPPAVWQCATKLRAPVSQLDHLIMNVIEAHLSSNTDGSGRRLLSTDLPPVQCLMSNSGNSNTSRMEPSLAWTMKCYNTLLSTRGFSLLPERLASFIVMYRFLHWQTTRSDLAYKQLYEWQKPRPSQLTIPHPQWMDFLPWPKLRDLVINDQERYGSLEFQRDYAENVSINFHYPPAKAVTLIDGQLRISELLQRHIADLNTASMRRPFADKYPELREVCRFEEV